MDLVNLETMDVEGGLGNKDEKGRELDSPDLVQCDSHTRRLGSRVGRRESGQ